MWSKSVLSINTALVFALALGMPLTEVSAKEKARGFIVKTKNGLEVRTKDKAYSVKIGTRVQYDFNRFEDVINQTETATDSDSFFRRARIEIAGEIPDWSYKFSYNLTDSASVDVLSVNYEGWGDMFEVMLGQQKEGFGLEDTGSSKWITAVERSMPSNAFSVGKNLGIRLHGANDTFTYSVGVFEENFESNAHALDRAATARVVLRPIYKKKKTFHLGVGYTTREGQFEELSARLGSRGGEERRANRIRAEYDRGAIADRSTAWNLEFAAILGRYHFMGEYFEGKLEGSGNAPDLKANGYYTQAGWVITGESRRYKKSNATFGEVSPKSRSGAWEIFTRFDVLDVSDSATGRLTDIDGGRGQTLTLGLNWYVNQYVKVAANYVYAKTERNFGGMDDGNAIAMRFQLTY